MLQEDTRGWPRSQTSWPSLSTNLCTLQLYSVIKLYIGLFRADLLHYLLSFWSTVVPVTVLSAYSSGYFKHISCAHFNSHSVIRLCIGLFREVLCIIVAQLCGIPCIFKMRLNACQRHVTHYTFSSLLVQSRCLCVVPCLAFACLRVCVCVWCVLSTVRQEIAH